MFGCQVRTAEWKLGLAMQNASLMLWQTIKTKNACIAHCRSCLLG
jgi:hypothetical protein